MLLKLDMIATLALAAVLLMCGRWIRNRIAFLDRYSMPTAVIGGFLFATSVIFLRLANLVSFEFDLALQKPLMLAFFTTIGLGASMKLLRIGGPQVLLFWLLASILAVLQSGVGIFLSQLMGESPFLGLIAGSVTMTGGHGTGAAFGALIEEQYGFPTAVPLAMAAATFGLVFGAIVGGPLGAILIRRHKLKTPILDNNSGSELNETIDTPPPIIRPADTLQVITVILVAMWLGNLLSQWLDMFITLPAYIGSMLVAALFRNVADAVKFKIEPKCVENIGAITLSLFLSMALMSLRLWELLDLAWPLLIILVVQIVLVGVFAYFVTARFMGNDYDAAVMASGQCGFGLGATPTAMANMDVLVNRYGPAPRAYLVVPMVGAFFIDFTNALIITAYLNLVA